MPQHTISVSAEAYERLKRATNQQLLQGKAFSLSRMIDYLTHFEESIREGWFSVYDAPEKEKAAKTMELIHAALDYKPPVYARIMYRRSKNADILSRADVMCSGRDRLGLAFSDKTTEEILDRGGTKSPRVEFVFRQLALERMEFEKIGLPEDAIRGLLIAHLEMMLSFGAGKDLTEEQLVAIQNEAKAKVQPPTQ